MRALIKRVKQAEVILDGESIGKCGYGMLVYQSICKNDTEKVIPKFFDRLLKLRIFPDEQGKTNLNINQIPESNEPRILLISNFSLYADVIGNLRPSFINVAEFQTAEDIYNKSVEYLKTKDIQFNTGKFGGDMLVKSDAEVFNIIMDLYE